MTNLYHFYHIYADGQWEEPVNEHLTAMKEHGLAEALTGFYLGIVGTDDNRELVKEHIAEQGLPVLVRTEAPIGWEQVTLEALRRHMVVNDGNVFYAHTKSAHDPADINIQWRKSMCYHNVVRWQEAVSQLETHDAVGCHWVNDAMFGGNYWWATGRHIRTLPPLGYANRWQAEIWIGQREKIPGLDEMKIHDLSPGWPHPSIFTTSW